VRIKCPLQKVALETQAALQNALPKRLIKVAPKPKLPSKCLAKTPYKSGPETQATLQMPC
jgi:hypothetical protein